MPSEKTPTRQLFAKIREDVYLDAKAKSAELRVPAPRVSGERSDKRSARRTGSRSPPAAALHLGGRRIPVHAKPPALRLPGGAHPRRGDGDSPRRHKVRPFRAVAPRPNRRRARDASDCAGARWSR